MKYLIAFLLLAGCASTPNLITTNQGLAVSGTIATDLQSAAYNFDQAVLIGALLPDDPAPKCLHSILIKAGIESLPGTPEAKSFVPKKDGLASAGAIAYILAQQAKRLPPLTVDQSCEALVGRVVIDGATAINKAVPKILPL